MARSKLVAAAALLAVALSAVDAAGPFGLGITARYQMAKRAQRTGDARRGHNLLLDEPAARVGGVAEYPPELFAQIVDHFPPGGAAPESTGVWTQRWWYNATHWGGAASGAPVFLFIEGEGPSVGRWVTQGHMMEMAQRYNALAVSLEHRFYGLSYPTADMSTKNLTLLTSKQALADLATFSAFIAARWNLTALNPFISFGGSYAGALSSWYREKHPDSVFAAVASSPPVQAALNFEEYDNVIYRSFANPLVGGSTECTAWIDWAYANLTALLTGNSAKQMEAAVLFNTCENVTSANDAIVFAAGMADNVKGIAQYNMNRLYGLNIDRTCAIMLNNTSPAGVVGQSAIQRLQTLFKIINGGSCMDISYTNMVQYLSAPQKDIDQASRQWTFQTCNEFGYFQDCASDSQCMFSDLETLQYYTNLCNDVYGISAATTSALIDATNAFYGALNPGSTRVIFVNGLIDPWHALSILTPLNDDLPAVTIADGSHCSDMSASKATDPDDLRNARIVIDAQVGAWINAAHNPPSGSSGLSTKEKVIIGVCVSVAAVLLIVLAVVCCRKKGGSSTADQQTGEFTRM